MIPSILDMVARLSVALTVGSVIGWQRERVGKAAGLRTHMLIALGTAALVAACERHGMQADPLSRIIQGIVTGIGFLGGGAILKLESEHHIVGLTTAAGIWLTTAASVAAGLGEFVATVVMLVLAWFVLGAVAQLERKIDKREHGNRSK